jgi:NAD(P) transhydrogenase subunit alpha
MSEAPQASIGVPRETVPGERRVALTPTALGPLLKAGARVIIESGAGHAAGFPDSAYTDKGAVIGTREEALGADLVAVVRVTGEGGQEGLQPGQSLVGMAAPFANPQLVATLAEQGVSLFSLELVPRTTRAQAMDVLSSQANVAGYKAVLLAAGTLPKMYPLLTTAAGTIAPAKVFIIGAGVAGLSAIATARRLGAVVEAYDVRPAVKEEVQSLGARFVELPLETGQEGAGSGAYAQQLSEETLARQRELMAKTVAGSDVVITTAQVQGAKAPVIITTEMIRGMASGSVVVDLAAEQGGNCEPTVAGETVDVDGVQVIGPVNLPGSIPTHASLMYGKNLANFVMLMLKDGAIDVHVDDDVVRECLVARNRVVLNARLRDALGLEPLPAPEEPEPTTDTVEEVTS